MSEQSTSRRAVLTGAVGVAASGALVAVPSLTATAAVVQGGDTPIQKLWKQYVDLLRDCERLSREADLAFDRLIAAMPPIPDELRTNFFHAHVNGLKDYVRVGNYGRGEVEWITAAGWRHRIQRPLCPAEEGPLAEVMMVTHDRARARGVLPIAERYEAACEAARIESGHKANTAAWEAALDRKDDLERRIMTSPATTTADLFRQSQIVREYDCDAWVAELVASIQAFAAGGVAGALNA